MTRRQALRDVRVAAAAWEATARNLAQCLELAAFTVHNTDPDLAEAMRRSFASQCAAHGLPLPAEEPAR